MTEKRLYTVINKEEPRKQSVALNGIPCTARHCVTELNALHEENQELKAFINRLTNNCGEIVLMNGNAYNVKKAVGDLE